LSEGGRSIDRLACVWRQRCAWASATRRVGIQYVICSLREEISARISRPAREPDGGAFLRPAVTARGPVVFFFGARSLRAFLNIFHSAAPIQMGSGQSAVVCGTEASGRNILASDEGCQERMIARGRGDRARQQEAATPNSNSFKHLNGLIHRSVACVANLSVSFPIRRVHATASLRAAWFSFHQLQPPAIIRAAPRSTGVVPSSPRPLQP